MKLLIALLGLLVGLLPLASQAAAPLCPPGQAMEDAFRKGVELAAANRYADSIPCFLIAHHADPQHPAVLWNLGIASAEVGAPDQALKYWLAYRRAEPDDWRGLTKLVQAYQALGDISARDKTRETLIELRRNAAAGSELRAEKHFCREQTVMAGRKVLAFEVFEPDAERAVFYFFMVLDATGRQVARYSLGSYEATSRIAREINKWPPERRLYHLDRYTDDGHATYSMYETRPTYEAVRASVAEILSGAVKPAGSTTWQKAP